MPPWPPPVLTSYNLGKQTTGRRTIGKGRGLQIPVGGLPLWSAYTDALSAQGNWYLADNAGSTVSGGSLTAPITSSYPAVYLQTARRLTGSSFKAKLAATLGNGTKEIFFEMGSSVYSAQFTAIIHYNGNGIYALHTINGVQSQVGTGVTVGSSVYLRLRETNGTLYYEYSSDDVTWNVLASEPTPFNMNALYFAIATGYYGTETASNVTVTTINS